MKAIHESHAIKSSLEELYQVLMLLRSAGNFSSSDTPLCLEKLWLIFYLSLQAVENMCSHRMASELYDQLKVVCEDYVKGNIHQFLQYPLNGS